MMILHFVRDVMQNSMQNNFSQEEDINLKVDDLLGNIIGNGLYDLIIGRHDFHFEIEALIKKNHEEVMLKLSEILQAIKEKS